MMKNTKRLIFTAFMYGFGRGSANGLHVIPNAGGVILPMHIPVLLCGLVSVQFWA